MSDAPGRRSLGVALVLVAGGCAGAGSGAPHLGAPIDPRSQPKTAPIGIELVGDVPPQVASMTGRIWSLAARARRLQPRAPVKLQVLSPSALVGVVKAHVKDDVPADMIRAEGRCFETLGLLPPHYEYEKETYALLEEELAGLYMPDDRTMYVATGIADDELEATLSHELVHALQDQHFQIGARMKYKPGAADALGALQGLAEGDATSAMIDEVILARKGEEGLAAMSAPDLPDRDAEDFLRESLGDKRPDAAIRRAPRFLALDLVSPYADGLAFVNALRRRGGWDAVDMAWQKPPVTSEQLLHVDKFDAYEPAVEVPVATAGALGAGWSKTYDDVFGEGAGRLAFGEWMSVATSKRAAAGWGGDRVTMFEKGGDHAVAWRIVFDDDAQAKEAATALEVGWTSAFGAPQQTGSASILALVFGGAVAPLAPPVDATPAGKKPGALSSPKPAKKPAGSVEAGGTLPPLPEATPTPTSTALPSAGAAPAKTPLPGCHALVRAGRAVTLLAGAPCGVAAAWSTEMGKAP